MAYNANRYNTAMTERIFAAPETTNGTAVAPTAAYGLKLLSGCKVDQEVPHLTDEQRRYTFSMGDPIQGKRNVGAFNIPIYMNMPSALGTAPEWRRLMKSVCGVETVTADTSVVYTLSGPTVAPNTVTLWYLDLISQRRATGAIVKELALKYNSAPSDQGSIFNAAFSGEFLQQSKCTEDLLNTATDGSSSVLVVTDGTKFQVGNRVQVNDNGTIDDNSGAGYPITAISTNTLTVTGTVAAHATPANCTVEPWAPSTVTEVGSPAHAGIGTSSIAGTTIKMVSADVKITSPWMIPTDEQSTNEYPGASYVPANKREISGTVKLYDKSGLGGFFGKHQAHTPVSMTLGVQHRNGLVAFKLEMPRVFLGYPTYDGDSARYATFPFKAAWSSAYEDEATISLIAP